MKAFIIVLKVLSIFYVVKGQNERQWMEIGRELYLIEPKAEYKWDEAVSECQKERSTLIKVKGDYDYAILKNGIRKNFKNHAPFWTDTQVKWTNIFNELGLGKDKNNRRKCHKFNNSTDFKFIPENCDKELGFICEKSLLNAFSSFYSKNQVYLVQPEEKFTCEQAHNECDKRDMFLLPFVDFVNYTLLKNYIFINYGSGPSFLFAFNNETHINCVTPDRNQTVKANSKFGFICHQKYSMDRALTTRHWILFIFVVVCCAVAIFIYVLIRVCWVKKLDRYQSSEILYHPEDVKIKNLCDY
ncbi:uncharacterized protein ACRADG_010749 [Cochliomyia hominivorax]